MLLKPNHKAALCYLPVLAVLLGIAYYDPYMRALISNLSAVALLCLLAAQPFTLGQKNE